MHKVWANIFWTIQDGVGDFETLDLLRKTGYKICEQPKAIDVRAIYHRINE